MRRKAARRVLGKGAGGAVVQPAFAKASAGTLHRAGRFSALRGARRDARWWSGGRNRTGVHGFAVRLRDN